MYQICRSQALNRSSELCRSTVVSLKNEIDISTVASLVEHGSSVSQMRQFPVEPQGKGSASVTKAAKTHGKRSVLPDEPGSLHRGSSAVHAQGSSPAGYPPYLRGSIFAWATGATCGGDGMCEMGEAAQQ